MYHLESLENRRLFTTLQPSAFEQYELELINRARANPSAEAARLRIDLNEGLNEGTISAAAKQPLAFNLNLVDSASRHSTWMLKNDTFSHTGDKRSDPGARMRTAGYDFAGGGTWGENIAYRSSFPNKLEQGAAAELLQSDLFKDTNVEGRGHRQNLMNETFKEIGVGLVAGEYRSLNAQMLTEDFARSARDAVFLTGVAYADTKTKNNFYTPGEGLSNVTVSARRTSDGLTFTTSTWASGGYTLKLSPGTYTIMATGGAMGGTVTYEKVSIGASNVKRDFRPDQAQGAPTPSGMIRGTVFNDADHDGVFDGDESGIASVLVYIDANNNGRRDTSERYARTNSDGAWKMGALADAKYTIRYQRTAGQHISAPENQYFRVNILNGKHISARNFGVIVSPASPRKRTAHKSLSDKGGK